GGRRKSAPRKRISRHIGIPDDVYRNRVPYVVRYVATQQCGIDEGRAIRAKLGHEGITATENRLKGAYGRREIHRRRCACNIRVSRRIGGYAPALPWPIELDTG